MKKISLKTVVWSGVLGILFFLVVVGVLNIIAANIENPIFHSLVIFLNQNVILIVVISVLILLGNIFEIFTFPLNLVYPWFNAAAGMLWVVFIFRALILVDYLSSENIYSVFVPLYLIALLLVPIIVLIVGYVHVFSGLTAKEKPEKRTKMAKKRIKWSDIGEEFKEALYNLGRTLKEAFAPKSGKKKRKK
jgi:hypothetical protein